MILFRAVKGRIEEKIFSCFVVNGMVACPPSESPGWQHVRLDWWLILNAIASEGLTICGFFWLFIGGYWQGPTCMALGWAGRQGTLKRRDELVCMRNLEFGIATRLRELGATSCNVSAGHDRELDLLVDFSRRLERLNFLNSELRKAKLIKAFSAESDHTCHYFNAQSRLPCAVHPNNLNEGLCNESCADFKPR